MSEVLTLIPPVERNVGANRALHPDRLWIRLVRSGAGLAMLAALAQELYDATQPGNSVDIPQLISQFTFQSNLVLGLVLLESAARRRAGLPQWWDHLFGALAFYLVMTGIIYVVLVAPRGGAVVDAGHVLAVDDHPPHRTAGRCARLAPRHPHRPWPVAAAPLSGSATRSLFLIFSWVRGALDGWCSL